MISQFLIKTRHLSRIQLELYSDKVAKLVEKLVGKLVKLRNVMNEHMLNWWQWLKEIQWACKKLFQSEIDLNWWFMQKKSLIA